MHENVISENIIGAVIEAHRTLGPGLLESVYEEALSYELRSRRIVFKRQQKVSIGYNHVWLETDLKMDLLIEDKVIVDLAKDVLSLIDKPKMLTRLRLSENIWDGSSIFMSRGYGKEFIASSIIWKSQTEEFGAEEAERQFWIGLCGFV